MAWTKRQRLARQCNGSSPRAALLRLSESLHPTFVDVSCEVLRRVFVELQPLSAIDFRVRHAEPFTNGIEIYLVLFNQLMHGFLYERIGIVVVATLDLLGDAPYLIVVSLSKTCDRAVRYTLSLDPSAWTSP